MSENSCKYTNFTTELVELCNKHGILLGGKLRLLNPERYTAQSQMLNYFETIYSDGITDRTGPFIVLSAQEKPQEPIVLKANIKGNIIIDKDKPLHGGVVNPIDGKKYDTRHKWDETLKRNGCRQSETNLPENRSIRPDDMRGNFNLRKELTIATREVLERNGAR